MVLEVKRQYNGEEILKNYDKTFPLKIMRPQQPFSQACPTQIYEKTRDTIRYKKCT